MGNKRLVIYTDGSEIGGEVGAAAWIPSTEAGAKAYMGTNKVSTGYAAELKGIHMALGMALRHLNRRETDTERVLIFTDNQASIQSTERPKNQSGQYILRKIYLMLLALQRRGVEVELRWIAANIGVAGNEKADELAKAAAGKAPDGKIDVPKAEPMSPLHTLTSASKRWFRYVSEQRWWKEWMEGKTGRVLQKLLEFPERSWTKDLLEHQKAIASVVVQMRTGKIGLKSYLKKINAAPDDTCACGNGVETVRHVVMDCPLYHPQRRRVWGDLHQIRDIGDILSDPAQAFKAASFMISTGLLGQFRYVPRTGLAPPNSRQQVNNSQR